MGGCTRLLFSTCFSPTVFCWRLRAWAHAGCVLCSGHIAKHIEKKLCQKDEEKKTQNATLHHFKDFQKNHLLRSYITFQKKKNGQNNQNLPLQFLLLSSLRVRRRSSEANSWGKKHVTKAKAFHPGKNQKSTKAKRKP